MKLKMRKYADENDFWRIRAFLREVLVANGLREFSWPVMRLDYWRWHCIENCQDGDPIEQVTFLWETPDGRLAAVLNPEERGSAYPQVHPEFKTPELEEELIETAEAHLTAMRGSARRLSLWTDAGDAQRLAILERSGYTRSGEVESQWHRDLDGPIPAAPLAAGYTVRSLADESELPARSWASWRGFHPNEPDEKYQGWEWYCNIQRCPLYRRDLDLVVAAPDGTIASFATFWYDDATRTTYGEPIATVPGHQRKGLARALIIEGLRRAQRLGAARAFISGYAPAPNALYASTLSPACERSEQWVKEW